MFQTVGHQAIIHMYAEAMKLPLFRGDIKSSSVNTESDYNKQQLIKMKLKISLNF